MSLLCLASGLFTYQCWGLPSKEVQSVSIDHLPEKTQKIVKGVNRQIGKTLFYDSSYKKLDYPGGDVSIIRGVCTDVVVRALRNIDIDLQKRIHEDMEKHFKLYPKNWGLKSPDKNIDHRRVPNQQVYFKRQEWSLPNTTNPGDYIPGDIVTWKLHNGRDHIGIVTDGTLNNRPLVVHNIGWGARAEDVLFEWEITGHYRLKFGKNVKKD